MGLDKVYRIKTEKFTEQKLKEIKTELPKYLNETYDKMPYAFSLFSTDWAEKEKWYLADDTRIMLKYEPNEIILGFVEEYKGSHNRHINKISKLIEKIGDKL